MTLALYHNDLPPDFDPGSVVAIDTETMGLNVARDRLCVVQVSRGDGQAALVKIGPGPVDAPNLARILTDGTVEKLFHFGRFDIAVLAHYVGAVASPVYCTKIASKIARTYTDKHSLKELCRELLHIDLSKQSQSSDWGADSLTDDQANYAASDVLYLHSLKAKLNIMLEREGRLPLAKAAFDYLPHRALLDIRGWGDMDIFAH